jgi:hypothetical protein
MINNVSRRSFLRILGLATTCAIVDPYFPVKGIITNPLVVPPLSEIYVRARYVKVSSEMLNDLPALTSFLRKHIFSLSNNDIDSESKCEIQIGHHEDDFVNNVKTIVLTYRGTNPPYIHPTPEELKQKYCKLLMKDNNGNYTV